MPAIFKVVIAVNIVCVIALALVALVAGGGFVSGVFPPDEGHEIKLIPILPDPPEPAAVPEHLHLRAEIPAWYYVPDAAPRPWVVLPDGSVRFERKD